MKKYKIAMALSASFLTFAALTGCGETAAPAGNPGSQVSVASETVAQTASETSTAEAESETAPPETTASSADSVSETENDITVVDDNFDSYEYIPEKDGVYSFKKEDPDDPDWEIYVLDEQFGDGIRYLFSNYEPNAVSDTELSLKAGQHIYCICKVNQWNSVEPFDNSLVIAYIGESSQTDQVEADAGVEDDDSDEDELKELAAKMFDDACKMQWDYFCSSDTLFELDHDTVPDSDDPALAYLYRIKDAADEEQAKSRYFSVFSKQFHENDLNSIMYSDDTGVYISNGARGMDITYVSSEVTAVKSYSDESAEFTVTNTYTDKVESTDFSLIKENGEWRVGTFTLPY